MFIGGFTIGFAGTSNRDVAPKYAKLSKTIGREIVRRGHRMASGGCSGGTTQLCAEGAQEWLKRNGKSEEINYRIISFAPDPGKEELPSIVCGQTLICKGFDRPRRRPFMTSMMDALITVNGSGGTKSEGLESIKVGTPVVPLFRTKGASDELWEEINSNQLNDNPIYKNLIETESWKILDISNLINNKENQEKLGINAVDLAVKLANQKLNYADHEKLLKTSKNQVFAIMPFSKEYDGVWAALKQVFNEKIYNIPKVLKCSRADDYVVGKIDQSILNSIRGAIFIIADLTDNNANVLYELGFSLGIGKKHILINQNPNDSVIDISNEKQISYDPNNLEKLKKDLVKGINQLLLEKDQ